LVTVREVFLSWREGGVFVEEPPALCRMQLWLAELTAVAEILFSLRPTISSLKLRVILVEVTLPGAPSARALS
jgi:hypothetical protein